MYKLGNYKGFEVIRVSAGEMELRDSKNDLNNLYVSDEGWMYYCGEVVGRVNLRNNSVISFEEGAIERVKREKSKPKAKEVEVAEARYVKEKEPVDEPAETVLRSWQGNIDGILERLMSKELVERA